MSSVAVIGYASLDHVAMLDGTPQAGRTTTILDRPVDAWPRLGGSPAYVAAALSANGVEAVPVSWIGDDEAGAIYRSRLVAAGVSDRSITAAPGSRTPIAILAYTPEGGCMCLYHPSASGHAALSPAQLDAIAGAAWLCVTVGPPAATERALEARGAGRLAWVVKHDPRAVPDALAARLAKEADVIFCSQAERAFVDAALARDGQEKPSRLLVETRGRAGASITVGSETVSVEAEPLDVTDPTGAGDTFAGGALAAIAGGETTLEKVVEAGHRAAHALLAGRRGGEDNRTGRA